MQAVVCDVTAEAREVYGSSVIRAESAIFDDPEADKLYLILSEDMTGARAVITQYGRSLADEESRSYRQVDPRVFDAVRSAPSIFMALTGR